MDGILDTVGILGVFGEEIPDDVGSASIGFTLEVGVQGCSDAGAVAVFDEVAICVMVVTSWMLRADGCMWVCTVYLVGW